MKRPSKKTNKDPERASGSGALDKAARHSKNKDVDERNLVGVDDAFQGAEFEDKVWLFWHKNKKRLQFFIIGLLLVVICFQGYFFIGKNKFKNMQDAYQESITSEQRLAFASKYKDKPLAGVALIQVADKQYKNEKYLEAAKTYSDALNSLNDTFLEARARVGQAISSIKGGEQVVGKSLLEKIVNDDKFLVVVRSEVLYHLLMLSLENKDYEEARMWVERAKQLGTNDTIWLQQILRLEATMTELVNNEGAKTETP